jgi:hypothetical protein
VDDPPGASLRDGTGHLFGVANIASNPPDTILIGAQDSFGWAAAEHGHVHAQVTQVGRGVGPDQPTTSEYDDVQDFTSFPLSCRPFQRPAQRISIRLAHVVLSILALGDLGIWDCGRAI